MSQSTPERKQCLLWVWPWGTDLTWPQRGGPDAPAKSNHCGAVKHTLGSEEGGYCPGCHAYHVTVPPWASVSSSVK